MSRREFTMRVKLSHRSAFAPVLASLAVLAGCTGTVGDSGPGAGGTPPTAAGGAVGVDGTTLPPLEGCAGPETSASKRIVRLSFNQIAGSLGALVDSAFGTKIVTDFEIVDAGHRAFPPLQSPREGNSLTDQS